MTRTEVERLTIPEEMEEILRRGRMTDDGDGSSDGASEGGI